MSTKLASAYLTIRHGVRVRRTVQIGPGLLVDVDEDWRVVGIENISGPVGFAQMADVIRAIPLNTAATASRGELAS